MSDRGRNNADLHRRIQQRMGKPGTPPMAALMLTALRFFAPSAPVMRGLPSPSGRTHRRPGGRGRANSAVGKAVKKKARRVAYASMRHNRILAKARR